MSNDKSLLTNNSDQKPENTTRREVLKKAVYIPPALVTLGTLTSLNSHAVGSTPPPKPGGAPLDNRNYRQ